METRIAYTFIKVAELGNITKAAEQLGYSQGAVTAQIKQLESDLGVSLFDRMGRGVQLTDAGKKFREYAERLVIASEDADAFAIDENDPTGKLLIEATSSVSIGILSKALSEFHSRYPRIKVSVRVSEDTDVLLDHLRQNRVDFAILLGPRSSYDGCALAAEREELFRFVAKADDPLAGKNKVPLEEVLDDSYISAFISNDRNMDISYVVESYLRQIGYDVDPSIEFGTIESVVKYLVNNGGHAFLPLFMIENELEQGHLCILDTEPIPVYEYTQMLYSSTRWLSVPMKKFIQFMQDYLT